MSPSDVENMLRNEMGRRGYVDIGHVVVYFNYQIPAPVVKKMAEDLGFVEDKSYPDRYITTTANSTFAINAAMLNRVTYGGRAGGNFNGLDALVDDDKPKVKKPKVVKTKVALDSVIISDEKKEEIQSAISQIKNEAIIFDEWGFDEVFEKGTAISMLFWGIPGTGKTLMAQAIADETGQKLKVYGNAEIQSSEPGGSERMVQQIFAEAKEKLKRGEGEVILFDECDSLLMDRNEVGPILGALVNTLLQELEKYEGIIIFTTNRMGKLDPALERRITAKIEFEFPDKAARKKIWLRMLPKKAPLNKDVDFDKLADYPLAGGNIKNAVLNAARSAAYKKSKEIKMEHFVSAIEREAKALNAFISEYEKTTHSSMLGYATRTTSGVSVDQKQVIKPRMMMKMGQGLKGEIPGAGAKNGKG